MGSSARAVCHSALRGAFGVAWLLVISACSSAADVATCSPLDATTTPVTLSASEIVAAGSGSDGTVYVLTESQSELRLFVSVDNVLVEQFETATAQVPGSTASWYFQYQSAQGTTVGIEVQKTGATTQMGLATGAIPSKGFDVGSLGQVLTLVDANTAAALTAQSSHTFHLEYTGADANGRDLVVVAPDQGEPFAGYRVFLGPLPAIAEQSVSGATKNVSLPSPTIINLTINGAPADLEYLGASATLRQGSSETAFTGSGVPAIADDAVFECQSAN